MQIDTTTSEVHSYPRLRRRIHAVTIDGSIVSVGSLAILLLLGPLHPNPWVFMVLFGGIFLVEPVLVSTTKGSIGHCVLGIQIVDHRSGERIGFPRALARMLIRAVFGLFSLFFIHTTREYRALHDILTGTVVVLRNPSEMAPQEVLLRQELEHPNFEYPSLLRRSLVIIFYSIIANFAVNLVSTPTGV